MPCDDNKETNECNNYISCQVNKEQKITFKNGVFEYGGKNIADIDFFSIGNMKKATRLDNSAWKQIKNLIIDHNKQQPDDGAGAGD